MKKILLFVLAISFGLYTIAQNRAVTPKAIRDVAVKTKKPIKDVGDTCGEYVPGVKSKSLLADTDIGNTWYDLQTNVSMQNRLYLYDDGTFGAAWTFGPEGSPGGNGRGTGYNYFDGNDWGPLPTISVEDTTKTGWPSYTPYGENGELFVCHHMAYGLLFGIRETKGTGAWEGNLQFGPVGAIDISWPRGITTGIDNNIIHFISVTYDNPIFGQTESLLYSRSSDGGDTWEIENHFFEELGPDYYTNLGGDIYEFAEPKEGLLTFLVGDNWTDLILMKSMDDGDTWDETIIWECPYPLNSGTPTDTFYCPDGSHHLAIDNSGLTHVVFGITRSYADDAGGHFYFPGVDGIIYWNENMPAFSNNLNALSPYGDPGTELIEDYNLIGWSQDVNGNGELDIFWNDIEPYNTGLSSMPQLIIDNLNRLFLIYSSVTETYDNGTSNYRHLWVRASPDCGTTWGSFYDMNSGLIYMFDECVYPSAAPNSVDSVYFIYQADNNPGTTTTSADENYIRMMSVSKTDVLGVKKNKQVVFDDNVSQNYPNPFIGTSTVYVNLDESAELSLEVHNIMGQLVYELPAKKYNAGKQEFIINGTNLE
ncbi:MAG: glycoside hydrolase, partial [Bacteroidales bacterium]|nr:glycoside hydrolase [Bacteroidales bacterium]